MHLATLVIGGLASIGGAGLLVAAFRDGQAGRTDAERVKFRSAVGALAVGALGFLATAILIGQDATTAG